MSYKLFILLILSLKAEAYQSEKIVTLIDQIDKSQAYWEAVTQDKKLNFWKRSPYTWLTKNWKKDVFAHQKHLAQQRIELIKHLAIISEASENTPTLKLQKQTSTALAKHGAPSHFKRRWISYAGIATIAAAIAFYAHQFKQDHVLFIIPPDNDSLASSLENLYPFSGHKYVADQDGTQYLQVKKSEQQKAQDFFAHKNISAVKSCPHISLCWRNEQGESKVREFIRKYGIQPIQKIYTILKNEDQPETKLFTTDTNRNEKDYENALNKVLLNALTVDETKTIMHQALKGKPIEGLSLPEKQEIFLCLTAELPDIINTLIKNVGDLIRIENQRLLASKKEPQLFTPIADNRYLPEWLRQLIIDVNLGKETANEGKELMKTLGGEAKKYANVINHITETSPEILGLIVQIITTTALELKLKEAGFTHIAQSAIRDAQLNIELSKMIPLMLSLYLCYASIKSIYQQVTEHTIIAPLKTDLVSLQLVLNKERYAKDYAEISQDFKGECFYWIQRLHRYKNSLPSSYRATYRRYLDELESKILLPEQKMTIIACLFQELDPLFRKD